MAKSPTRTDPKKQLESFLEKYDPKIAEIARKCLVKMRKRLHGAIELVYDNYNALAVGFGPSERASEAIFSIVPFPRYVTLFFLQGAGLPDPHKRFEGKGKVARHVKLESADTLDDPEIVALMNAALHVAKVALDPTQKTKLVIKSISAKQRPRRAK